MVLSPILATTRLAPSVTPSFSLSDGSAAQPLEPHSGTNNAAANMAADMAAMNMPVTDGLKAMPLRFMILGDVAKNGMVVKGWVSIWVLLVEVRSYALEQLDFVGLHPVSRGFDGDRT